MKPRRYSADDFRRMILDDLPELAPEVAGRPAGSHRDAAALRRFAEDAIRAGDVDLTVRVFRLARRLVDVGGELDYYSENALWTEFLQGYAGLSDRGLAVFRRMPPDVRRSVHCPFVIPHTWFDREPLDVPCPAGRAYAPAAVAEGRARHVRQTGGPGYYADVTLRLSPVGGRRRPMFVNGVPPERDLPLGVVECVRDWLAAWCRGGRRLCGAEIAITACGYHAVDTRSTDVARASAEALDRALTAADLVER